jgi:hypothetical protein
VRPGWKATYDEKAWEERKHFRRHAVRCYVWWTEGPTLYDRVSKRFGWDVEAPPIPYEEPPPRNTLTQHYFPLAGEQGTNAVLPGFQYRQTCSSLLCEYSSMCWNSYSDGCHRKTIFVLILTGMWLMSWLVVHFDIAVEK